MKISIEVNDELQNIIAEAVNLKLQEVIDEVIKENLDEIVLDVLKKQIKSACIMYIQSPELRTKIVEKVTPIIEGSLEVIR